MAPSEPQKVCGAVYFGFEVMRCQLPAGHAGAHEAGGQRWAWTDRVTVTGSYQAQVRKRAVLKAGDAARQASDGDAPDNSA